MDYVFLAAILTQLLPLSISFTVPPGKNVRCPSKYSVQVTDGRVVKLKVVDNKTECDQLVETRKAKGVYTDDVEQSITVDYKEGEYIANISWEFRLKGKRLPRIFLINLTFYDTALSRNYKFLGDTCVVLKILGNRKLITEDPVKFYFDCLPLLDEPYIGMEVQLWSYSKHGIPCRSLRSLPEERGLCGPDIKCSTKYGFPISKNEHSYRQCKCYVKYHGDPILNLKYDNNKQKFNIHFTNIPPFLSQANIEIIDAQNDTKVLGDIKPNMYNQRNGEIQVNSSKFDVGESTVNVLVKLKLHLGCITDESPYKREVDDVCKHHDSFTYHKNITKVSPRKPEKVSLERTSSPQTVFGIAGGVIMTGIVSTVAFVLYRKRKLHTSSVPGDVIEMNDISPEQEPLRGENEPALQTETEFHPQELQTKEEVIYTRNNNIAIENEYFPTHMLCQVPQQLKSVANKKQMENFHAQAELEKDIYQVVLLYHPDSLNPKHIQKVAEFEQILTNKYGVFIESRPSVERWSVIAESAFVKFNVLLIISDGLFKVCHHYIHSRNTPGELLSGRNQELVPCIVLDQIKTLVRNDSEAQACSTEMDICLHIINFDNEDNNQVLQLFLNEYPFLNGGHSRVYNFCGTELYLEDFSELVSKFKPADRKGMPPNLQQCLMRINAESECLHETT